jgi:D-arginine dehydrogenase
MQRVDTLIVGGGVAGAALAYHLATGASARGGARSVALLERAGEPGRHASGRNARLVLQSVADPLVRGLTVKSAAEYAARRNEVGFRISGSIQLGVAERLALLRGDGVESHILTADEVRARIPLVANDLREPALWTPGDGVLDPHRLLAFFLDGARAAGAAVTMGADVVAVHGDGPFRVETSAGVWHAERVVDAAGAWSNELAARAGVDPLPLVAYKRHVFLQPASLDLSLPHVWLLDPEVYFRPDENGALTCMCDEEPTGVFEETVSERVEERLRERLGRLAPALAAAPITRVWSCFRTRATDSHPLIGPDPQRPRFWWLGGLGGFGLGASWEVGRLAARALTEGESTLPAEVLPSRFARSAISAAVSAAISP